MEKSHRNQLSAISEEPEKFENLEDDELALAISNLKKKQGGSANSAVYLKERMEERIKQLQNQAKERLTSKRQNKKLLFKDKLTIVSDKSLIMENFDINDDIKREINIHKIAQENVDLAITQLENEKVKIVRPDDYFVEMYKSDVLMAKVKNRLVQQSVKAQDFEEKKTRKLNKKFAKYLKSQQEVEKSQKKKQELQAIENWKNDIKAKGSKAKDLSEYLFQANNKKNPKSKQIKKDKSQFQRGGQRGVNNKQQDKNKRFQGKNKRPQSKKRAGKNQRNKRKSGRK